jgi:3-oxoacyl-[acyl-carrier-protein] synthase III
LEPGRFGIANLAMAEAAVKYLVSAAHEALAAAELSMEDMDWVLPHQPNGLMFDRIVEALNVPRERTLKVVHEIGSTGAASIPYSLDSLVRSGRVKANDKILMTSVGGGASYGALVVRVGSRLAAGMENLRL